MEIEANLASGIEQRAMQMTSRVSVLNAVMSGWWC